MQKIPCQLIVCGPAVGKTYLAETDSRFVDLDEMKAIYKYGLQRMPRREREAGKMQRGKAVRLKGCLKKGRLAFFLIILKFYHI